MIELKAMLCCVATDSPHAVPGRTAHVPRNRLLHLPRPAPHDDGAVRAGRHRDAERTQQVPSPPPLRHFRPAAPAPTLGSNRFKRTQSWLLLISFFVDFLQRHQTTALINAFSFSEYLHI